MKSGKSVLSIRLTAQSGRTVVNCRKS